MADGFVGVCWAVQLLQSPAAEPLRAGSGWRPSVLLLAARLRQLPSRSGDRDGVAGA